MPGCRATAGLRCFPRSVLIWPHSIHGELISLHGPAQVTLDVETRPEQGAKQRQAACSSFLARKMLVAVQSQEKLHSALRADQLVPCLLWEDLHDLAQVNGLHGRGKLAQPMSQHFPHEPVPSQQGDDVADGCPC